jgi:hypothetical protein
VQDDGVPLRIYSSLVESSVRAIRACSIRTSSCARSLRSLFAPSQFCHGGTATDKIETHFGRGDKVFPVVIVSHFLKPRNVVKRDVKVLRDGPRTVGGQFKAAILGSVELDWALG